MLLLAFPFTQNACGKSQFTARESAGRAGEEVASGRRPSRE